MSLSANRMPLRRDMRYFRTQIRRITDVFASDDDSAVATPSALRKSRTISACAGTACLRAALFAGPPTTTGFSKPTPWGASARVERKDVRQPVIAAAVGEYFVGATSVAA
jgi:hypothetical protein